MIYFYLHIRNQHIVTMMIIYVLDCPEKQYIIVIIHQFLVACTTETILAESHQIYSPFLVSCLYVEALPQKTFITLV